MQRINPRTAGWEERMLPWCYSAPGMIQCLPLLIYWRPASQVRAYHIKLCFTRFVSYEAIWMSHKRCTSSHEITLALYNVPRWHVDCIPFGHLGAVGMGLYREVWSLGAAWWRGDKFRLRPLLDGCLYYHAALSQADFHFQKVAGLFATIPWVRITRETCHLFLSCRIIRW